MRQESSVILNHFFSDIEKRISHGYTLFQFKDRNVYLLEIGFVNITDLPNLESAISQINPGLIINFGICGALHRRVTLNQNYMAKSVHYNNAEDIILSQDLDMLKSLSKSNWTVPIASLLTVKDPVLDSRHREELWQSTHCELVDMEAYYIALNAQRLGIPVAILKQVTDYADERAKQQIKGIKKRWQESLYQGLTEIVEL
jgi:nucleoside phosphorylase